MAAVVEILQSIRQSEMSPLLTKIYQSEGGVELLDVLMKYLCACSFCRGESLDAEDRSTDSFLKIQRHVCNSFDGRITICDLANQNDAPVYWL